MVKLSRPARVVKHLLKKIARGVGATILISGILNQARVVVAEALVTGKALRIQGGDYEIRGRGRGRRRRGQGRRLFNDE